MLPLGESIGLLILFPFELNSPHSLILDGHSLPVSGFCVLLLLFHSFLLGAHGEGGHFEVLDASKGKVHEADLGVPHTEGGECLD
jgi:hypothetical protein